MAKKIPIFILIILALGLIVYFVSKPKSTPLPEEEGLTENPISESATVENPVENLPELNPFDASKVNPYSDGYKNPFE